MIEVTVYLDEDDAHAGKPTYEYLMRYLMHHEIAGASLFAALGGFGAKRHLHFPRKIGAADEGPLMLIFVDEEAKILPLIPHIKEVVPGGLILKKEIEKL